MIINDKHVFELIGNDPNNIKIINETLWDIKETIFDNLYTAQRSLSNINRFDISMENFSEYRNTEVMYNINFNFIENPERLKFKTSKFYKKELTLENILSNTDIFSNSVLLFINGELYTNFYLIPNEDITTIKFKLFNSFPDTPAYIRNGFTMSEMKDLIVNNAKMTIFIINNHNETINKINRPTLFNYALDPKYLGLPIDTFIPVNDIKYSNIFSSWVTYDDERLYKYRLIATDLKNDNKLYFNSDEIKVLKNKYSYLKNIYIQNHINTLYISEGNEYFELEIKDMPIPIENIMIFRKTNNIWYFDHDSKITMYYPNIYKINKDHNDDILIHVYYHDDTVSIGSKYNNEISLYSRFMGNILDKFKDNSIHDIIKNYSPIRMVYDNKDFNDIDIDHLQYKFDKLNTMINQNGNYYSIYLDKLIGYVPRFILKVSEIENLSNRYRENTRGEIENPAHHIDFSEPHYVFTFRHHSNYDNIIVNVDEYHINEMYYIYDTKYLYVYIPIRFIKPNSIICIEKFFDFKYSQKIIINNTSDYIKLDIPKNAKNIQMSDIYIGYTDIDGKDKYLNTNKYKLYTLINNEYIEITKLNDFYQYDNVYINFTDENDIGKDIIVYINRMTFKKVIKNSNIFELNIPINNDGRNMLIFKNGRLLPRHSCSFMFSDNISGTHNIRALHLYEPDDEFTLIYNTNKYFRVHYQESIDSKGIVNLTNRINKPLDFKWYDIYLNGLKLDESNIEIVSPYIMIIHNISTTKHLEIYQKNLDNVMWDKDHYPTDDTGSNIYEDIINDYNKDNFDDIDDNLDDILDSMFIDFIGFLDKHLYTITLINPDIQQITEDMVTEFPNAFDIFNNIFINPNKNIRNMESAIFLNPDNSSDFTI